MSLTVEKCLQAWSNSLRQMNAKVDVVFFGDSLTFYGDFSSIYPDKVVCNLGLRGDTLKNMVERVQQIKTLYPRVIYLMAGINDVPSCTLDQFELQYESLINTICLALPQSKLIIESILPVNNVFFHVSCNNEQIRACNLRIKELSNRHNLDFLDLFSLFVTDGVLPAEMTIDGLHLNGDAYYRWYGALDKIKSMYL